MSSLAHVLRMARVDVARMVRKHTDTSQGLGRLVSLLVFVVFVGAATLGGGYLAYRVGGAVGTGDVTVGPFQATAALRGVVAVFGVIGAVVVALRAVGQRGTLTNAEGVLTVVPTGEAFLGLLLAESAYVLLWLAGPAVGVGVGLALATGSALAVVTVPLGVAAIGVTVVAVGFPVGLGLKHLFSRIAFVARNKGLIVVLAFVVYFAFVVTGSLNAAVVALFDEAFADEPVFDTMCGRRRHLCDVPHLFCTHRIVQQGANYVTPPDAFRKDVFGVETVTPRVTP